MEINPSRQRSIKGVKMDLGVRFNNFGNKLLNEPNYKILKLFMEPFLGGDDLWEVFGGRELNRLETTPENAEALKEWMIANAKADSILK